MLLRWTLPYLTSILGNRQSQVMPYSITIQSKYIISRIWKISQNETYWLHLQHGRSLWPLPWIQLHLLCWDCLLVHYCSLSQHFTKIKVNCKYHKKSINQFCWPPLKAWNHQLIFKSKPCHIFPQDGVPEGLWILSCRPLAIWDLWLKRSFKIFAIRITKETNCFIKCKCWCLARQKRGQLGGEDTLPAWMSTLGPPETNPANLQYIMCCF